MTARHPFGSGPLSLPGYDNWKTDAPSEGLDPDPPVELKCLSCGRHYELWPEDYEACNEPGIDWPRYYCTYRCAQREHNPEE